MTVISEPLLGWAWMFLVAAVNHQLLPVFICVTMLLLPLLSGIISI